MIQTRLTMAQERPLLLISWLSLVAFDDLPEFSVLTGIPAEHLIQSLLYRLRRCGEARDNNRAQENVKVENDQNNIVFIPKFKMTPCDNYCPFYTQHTRKTLAHILQMVDKEQDR